MSDIVSRRGLLVGSSAMAAAGLAPLGYLALAETRPPHLKPGEFTWTPGKSPQGLVAIIVSIPDQLVHIYRNGVRIGLSTCSTGKKGHATPTGVFTILQKDKHHHSSTYNNAPMPNMNRLTWKGVALHAGKLPGFPASHGCIRLPLEFSELLFGITHVGTPVIIADEHSQPAFVTHPGAILSALAEDEMDVALAEVAKKKMPASEQGETASHTVSIVISGADRELLIIKNGDVIARGRIEIDRPNNPLGSHVFVLVGSNDQRKSLHWKCIAFTVTGAQLGNSKAALIDRVTSSPELARKVAEQMHPGLVLVMTDAPAHPDTRSDPGFVVMAQETGWETQVRSAN